MKISLQKANINFGVKLDGDYYNHKYIESINYNGSVPDEFILSRLKTQSKPTDVIFDLGAGQGRNTIPIAQMGYNRIFACEISPEGRQCIKKKAVEANVKKNIKLLNSNMLDNNMSIGQKANFAFMSHVSQHFSIKDIQKFFTNLSANIANGGELIFDAFIRKDISNVDTVFKQLCLAGKKSELMGLSSFEENDIIKAAQDAGFKLVQETPFTEKGEKRAFYEAVWETICRAAKKIVGADGINKKPIELLWFVFKKT